MLPNAVGCEPAAARGGMSLQEPGRNQNDFVIYGVR